MITSNLGAVLLYDAQVFQSPSGDFLSIIKEYWRYSGKSRMSILQIRPHRTHYMQVIIF